MLTDETLRAALMAVRPALAQMPASQRRKVCADLAARLRTRRKAGDSGIYAALAGAKRSDPKNTADLGRRIMAGRNANYKK